LLDVNQKVLASEARIDKNNADMKMFIIKNMPSQTILTKLFNKKLTRMTFFTLNKLNEEYTAASCDGSEFKGCKSNFKDLRTEDDDKLFYCSKCKYTICAECNNGYSDLHQHSLKETTYGALKIAEPAYAEGWGCDCRDFEGCHTEAGYVTTDPNAVLFHNEDANFDLCEKCGEAYAI
jgi:hypothetical protein